MSVRSINAARANREDDNTLLSPIEALQDAIARIEDGQPVDKLLILTLDTSDDQFSAGFQACNIKASEMLALLEVVRTKVLISMNYIPEV